MKELHIASKPLLALILESVSVNLFYHQTSNAIEKDPEIKESMLLHIDELHQMHDHLTELLKD